MRLQPRLVVSFHDLTPASRPVCDRFLERLRTSCAIHRISLLVVPHWHGGRAFTEDEAFVSWLRQRVAEGHEICLHGLIHRAERVAGGPVARFLGQVYTAREGEFFQVSAREAEERVRQGLALFSKVGLPVCGFTPPAWLLSHEGREALRRLGLLYTTTFNHIDLLQQGRRIHAPVLVFSARSAWRRYASRAWVWLALAWHRHPSVLRVAVHPIDFAYPEIEASLFALIGHAVKGRLPCTYRDLLSLTLALPGQTHPPRRE